MSTTSPTGARRSIACISKSNFVQPLAGRNGELPFLPTAVFAIVGVSHSADLYGTPNFQEKMCAVEFIPERQEWVTINSAISYRSLPFRYRNVQRDPGATTGAKRGIQPVSSCGYEYCCARQKRDGRWRSQAANTKYSLHPGVRSGKASSAL